MRDEEYYNLNTDSETSKEVKIGVGNKISKVNSTVKKESDGFLKTFILTMGFVTFINIMTPDNNIDNTKEHTDYATSENVVEILNEHEIDTSKIKNLNSKLTVIQRTQFVEDLDFIAYNLDDNGTIERLQFDTLVAKWTPILEEAKDEIRLGILNKAVDKANGVKEEHDHEFTNDNLLEIVDYLRGLE